jgi:purine-binding chemotaxis protein CheW
MTHLPVQEPSDILRVRAKALAQEPQKEEAPADTLLVVEFLLSGEHYALEVQYVREVAPLRELTPLPGTPPFLVGMINLRRQIVAVMDVKVFFDLPRPALSDLNRVIVVENQDFELGILADEIVGVRPLSLVDIQPALPTLTGIGAEYLRGVTRDPIIILDVAVILADERIIVQDGEIAS